MSRQISNKLTGGTSLGMLLLKGRTFIALLILLIFFSFKAPNFTQWSSIVLMVKHSSIYGLLALGMTLVIATGGIDISVGSTMALSSIVLAKLAIHLEVSFGLSLLAALVAAALFGLFN